MTKYIRTNLVLGRNGKPLKGDALRRALRERHRERQKCRICQGTKVMEERLGGSAFHVKCPFCDEEGYARYVCDDCGGALPMCKCVREPSCVVQAG